MQKITSFKDIPRFTSSGNYTVNVPLDYIQSNLEHYMLDRGMAKLDMNPDFQRGHVWTEAQQVAFMEYFLAGGQSGRNIYFNCVGWMGSFKGPFVLVDGKQRLTAALAFMENKLRVFGSLRSEFVDNIRMADCSFLFTVNNLKTREEVLRWYLQMNSGGTPHSPEELAKVRMLIAENDGPIEAALAKIRLEKGGDK